MEQIKGKYTIGDKCRLTNQRCDMLANIGISWCDGCKIPVQNISRSISRHREILPIKATSSVKNEFN